VQAGRPEFFTALPRCLAVRGDTPDLGATRIYAVAKLGVGFGGGPAEREELQPGLFCSQGIYRQGYQTSGVTVQSPMEISQGPPARSIPPWPTPESTKTLLGLDDTDVVGGTSK